MNKLVLDLQIIEADDHREIDGIDFSSCALVRVNIDGKALVDSEDFSNALVVFSELEKSADQTGRFLIFTSATGIADEDGWDGVSVSHTDSLVFWKFLAGGLEYRFEFDRDSYHSSIGVIQRSINNLSTHIELEPVQVFFPETWG